MPLPAAIPAAIGAAKGVKAAADAVAAKRFRQKHALNWRDYAIRKFNAAGIEVGKKGRVNYLDKYKLYAADIPNSKWGQNYDPEFGRIYDFAADVLLNHFGREAYEVFVQNQPRFVADKGGHDQKLLQEIINNYPVIDFNKLIQTGSELVTKGTTVVNNLSNTWDVVSDSARKIQSIYGGSQTSVKPSLVTTTSGGGGSNMTMILIAAFGVLVLFGKKLLR